MPSYETWCEAIRWSPGRGAWEVRDKHGHVIALNRAGVYLLHEQRPDLTAEMVRWPNTWIRLPICRED